MENLDFWEFALSANIQKSKWILLLKSKVENLVKNSKGIITTIYSNNEITLLVGLSTAQKMQIKPVMLSIITDIIVDVYKAEYIVKQFDFKVSEDLLFGAFVKALCVFDIDVDRQIIYQKLLPYESINLDSFFDFKLKFLKQKWDDLVALANDNYIYLLSNNNFAELIKFLISNLESKENIVSVQYLDSRYKLEANGKEIKMPLACDNCDDQNLIESLIYFCPKKIVLDNSRLWDNGVVDTINLLFENRVEIIK